MATTLNVDKEAVRGDYDVTEKENSLQDAVNDGAQFIERCRDAYDTRNCLWDGQSDDARKHGDDLGAEPFPFEGASDVRIHLVDEVVNDHRRILQTSLMRSQVQATPIESKDAPASAARTTLLKWAIYTKLAESFRAEVSLLANWQELYALSVMAVTWQQEIRMTRETLTLEELQAIEAKALQQQGAEESQAGTGELAQALFDETREDEVAAHLMTMWPALKKGPARQAVRDLRTTGQCEVPQPIVIKNEPKWSALRVFRDVFWPANTCDVQSAAWVAFREAITEAELKKRVLTDDYDEDEVDEVIARCQGKTVLDSVKVEDNSKTSVIDDMKDLYEIISMYEKETDEDGYTTINVCVFCPGSGGGALSEYPLSYDHGEYPFTEFVRDRTERILIENKGVSDVVASEQDQVKTSRDFRTDRASVAINPPKVVPMGRATSDLIFGPGKTLRERRPGDLRWMEPPRFDADTVQLELQVRQAVNDYFGRLVEGVNPTRQALYAQNMTDNWLAGFRKVARQTLSLCEQYLSDEEIMRITGVPVRTIRDPQEKAREYDFQLEFNAQDLNLEMVLKKLEVVNKAILPADTMGVIDRAFIVEWAMRAVDPSLAQGAVRSQQAASNAEITDEQNEFTKISSGVEPQMAESGQNFALREKVLLDIVQKNPNIQKRLQVDEIFRAMIENRLKHFQFQLQQQKNAQIGRVGTAPTLEGPTGNGAPTQPGGY